MTNLLHVRQQDRISMKEREGRNQAIDDENVAPLVAERARSLTSWRTGTEEKGTTSMTGSNFYTGTEGVKWLVGGSKWNFDVVRRA